MTIWRHKCLEVGFYCIFGISHNEETFFITNNKLYSILSLLARVLNLSVT